MRKECLLPFISNASNDDTLYRKCRIIIIKAKGRYFLVVQIKKIPFCVLVAFDFMMLAMSGVPIRYLHSYDAPQSGTYVTAGKILTRFHTQAMHVDN